MTRTANGKKDNAKKQAERKEAAQWNRIAKASPYDDDPPLSAATLGALQRIDVSVAALHAVPRITPLLAVADGGMKTVFNAMRMTQGDAVIAAFLAKYDSIPVRYRRHLPMEAVAIAAGVNITALLGAIMIALERQAISVVKIMAVTSHPKIVAARIKYGQLPSGDRDRAALDQAVGFLPSPKAPMFIGKAVYNSGKAAMDAQRSLNPDDDDEDEAEIPLAAESDIDLDELFPPPRLIQEKLVAIRQKLALPPDTGKKTIQ